MATVESNADRYKCVVDNHETYPEDENPEGFQKSTGVSRRNKPMQEIGSHESCQGVGAGVEESDKRRNTGV
jgi:hypothetical protein